MWHINHACERGIFMEQLVWKHLSCVWNWPAWNFTHVRNGSGTFRFRYHSTHFWPLCHRVQEYSRWKNNNPNSISVSPTTWETKWECSVWAYQNDRPKTYNNWDITEEKLTYSKECRKTDSIPKVDTLLT